MSAITFETKIDDLELSVRAYNCLKNERLQTVGDIFNYTRTRSFRAIRNVGRKTSDEIMDILDEAINRKGDCFVARTIPAKGYRMGHEWVETVPSEVELYGPFPDANSAQEWRDNFTMRREGETVEILFSIKPS